MKEIFVDRSGSNREPAFQFFPQTFIIAGCYAWRTATTRCQTHAGVGAGGCLKKLYNFVKLNKFHV